MLEVKQTKGQMITLDKHPGTKRWVHSCFHSRYKKVMKQKSIKKTDLGEIIAPAFERL